MSASVNVFEYHSSNVVFVYDVWDADTLGPKIIIKGGYTQLPNLVNRH